MRSRAIALVVAVLAAFAVPAVAAASEPATLDGYSDDLAGQINRDRGELDPAGELEEALAVIEQMNRAAQEMYVPARTATIGSEPLTQLQRATR